MSQSNKIVFSTKKKIFVSVYWCWISFEFMMREGALSLCSLKWSETENMGK